MKIYIRIYKIKCPFMQIFALKIAEFFHVMSESERDSV